MVYLVTYDSVEGKYSVRSTSDPDVKGQGYSLDSTLEDVEAKFSPTQGGL